MLDRLRDQAFRALAATSHCTLSTVGPAGLCASNVALAVAVESRCLYVLISNTSDHLFNLERDTAVALTAATWELRGQATQISASAAPFTHQQTAWSVVFQIIPQRMHLPADAAGHPRSTIDF